MTNPINPVTVEQRHRDAAAWALDQAPNSMTWEHLTAARRTPDQLWQANRVAQAFAQFERDHLATRPIDDRRRQCSECRGTGKVLDRVDGWITCPGCGYAPKPTPEQPTDDSLAIAVAALERAQEQFEAIGNSYGNGALATHLMHMASVGLAETTRALTQIQGATHA